MNKYIILPDVTCDLCPEIREEIGLQDYVHGYVHINDESIRTTLDWSAISRADFYKALSDKKNQVSSAVASPEEFYQKFLKYAQQGYSIISMSLSAAIRGTHSATEMAARRIREEFPQLQVHCVDTRRMSGAFGLLVIYACDLQRQGKSFDEVVAWLEENKARVHQMGPMDDLSYIARRGRISKGKAVMATLAGIKPMGDANAEGYVTVLGKAKGIKKALDATVGYLKRMAVDVQDQYIIISHSDREEYALTLKAKVEQACPCKKVYISDVYGSCGPNIGPGMVGVYFLGEPISEDCAKEKKILAQALAEA